MAGGGGAGAAEAGPRTRFKSPVPKKRARIEIIPLIDVMFFLLASFMMVSLSLQKAKTPAMNLAVARTAASDFKPDMLNIAVEANGNVSVGKTNISFAVLDEMLAAAARRNTNSPIFVTGDRETPHGAVNRVLTHVRQAGFMRVSFAVQKPKTP